MWAEQTIKIVGRLYLLLLAGLLVIVSIHPDTIGELIPGLPFDIDWTDARLLFNLSLTVLVLGLLWGWEKRRVVFRFFALGGHHTNGRSNRIVSSILLLVALLAAPLLFAFPPPFAAGTVSITELEQDLANRINAAGSDVLRPATQPAPEPARDHLAFTKLPVMHLEIPSISRHELSAMLPRDLGSSGTHFSKYSGENDFSWEHVPAFFHYQARKYPVDIRYRGWKTDHFLGFKKSWRIKFRRDDLFFGRRQFNLINQRDHSLINDILWSELLRDSGFLVPYQFLVHVRINNEFVGVQTFLEQPDRLFAERHNRNSSDLYGEIKPITSPQGFLAAGSWQQYASHTETKTNDFIPLTSLYTAVYRKDAPDYLPQLERHLDVDHYLKYLAHGMINCQENPSTHNIRWIRDPGVGRFQILPWYQAPHQFVLTGYYELWQRQGWDYHPPLTAINDLADGLLRRPEVRQRCLTHLWRLLRSTHHRDRIRQRIDELYERFRPDAYADNHMHYAGDMRRYISTAEWEQTVNRLRELTQTRNDYLEQALIGGPLKLDTHDGSLALFTTNYADATIAEIAVRFRGDQAPSLTIGTNVFQPASVTDQHATYRPAFRLASVVRRIPVPLGPGIIVADLDRVPNPDLDFLGSVSKLAAHYQPQTTFYPVSGSGVVEVVSATVTNNITGRRLSVLRADGRTLTEGDETAIAGYSAALARLVHPHPPEQPRAPELTGKPVRPDGIVLSDRPLQLRSLVLETNITVTTNWHIAPDEHLIIRPDVTLTFASNASLIVHGPMTAIGRALSPIIFTAREESWGVVFLNSLHRRTNRFAHCIFEKSANVRINGMPVTASLAAYTSPVTVSNCTFAATSADDAFNAKYVSPIVAHCHFTNNLDAIDIDMGGGLVTDCVFAHNLDDSIDLSSSWARIENNLIYSHGDKGVSVGEKSRPLITNNLIANASIGVAVKDLSHAVLTNNTFLSNRTDVALYQKKISFGPGTAEMNGRLLTNNLHRIPD